LGFGNSGMAGRFPSEPVDPCGFWQPEAGGI